MSLFPPPPPGYVPVHMYKYKYTMYSIYTCTCMYFSNNIIYFSAESAIENALVDDALWFLFYFVVRF